MASKSSDVRPKITLACVECKERNYITKKNRRNDPDMMPPLASNVRDTAGEALIGAWIDSLTPANCQ